MSRGVDGLNNDLWDQSLTVDQATRAAAAAVVAAQPDAELLLAMLGLTA